MNPSAKGLTDGFEFRLSFTQLGRKMAQCKHMSRLGCTVWYEVWASTATLASRKGLFSKGHFGPLRPGMAQPRGKRAHFTLCERNRDEVSGKWDSTTSDRKEIVAFTRELERRQHCTYVSYATPLNAFFTCLSTTLGLQRTKKTRGLQFPDNFMVGSDASFQPRKQRWAP